MADARQVVYLANMTNDLIKQHRAVKRFLLQESDRLRVLPETVDPVEFRQQAGRTSPLPRSSSSSWARRRPSVVRFAPGINGLMDGSRSNARYRSSGGGPK